MPDPSGPGVRLSPESAGALVARHAEPFERVDAFDPTPLLERIGDARVVCLGEATHGTSEFYRLRSAITQALIRDKGFSFVAWEADWPDAERVDAYVRHREPGEQEWEAFARFPTWMWRNEEVREFVEWLREWNAGRSEGDRVGCFGLDLYSLYTSLGEVLRFLDARDPELAADARRRYGLLLAFASEPADYGRALAMTRVEGAADEATAMLRHLLSQRLDAAGDAFPLFNAVENARVVRDAEAYYREMFVGRQSTWNLRDQHMVTTLHSLLAFFGEGSGTEARAVVWAHNSHVGNAAATEMGRHGEVNVGSLCREAFGDRAYLVGFGTHAGTVLAAEDWDAPGRVRRVRPSHPDSYEHVAHASGVPHFALPLRDAAGGLRRALAPERLERAIGVVYRPDTERQSHYFGASLPAQFDEWIWVDETHAVRPLSPSAAPALPRAHPFGLLAD